MPYRSDPSVSQREALHELADHWQRLSNAGEAPEYGFCGQQISELLAAGDPNNTYLPTKSELGPLIRTQLEILLKAFDALAGDPREVHITRSGVRLSMWDLRETVRSLGRAIEVLELVGDRRNKHLPADVADARPAPLSWDDLPREDPNFGRVCGFCGCAVPAGARYEHGRGLCVDDAERSLPRESPRAISRDSPAGSSRDELEEARKNITLGSYLRAWRMRAGLSLEQVAEALGSHYDDIECDQGIVSPEKLKLLCAAIPGTNLVWLTKLRTKLVLQQNAAE